MAETMNEIISEIAKENLAFIKMLMKREEELRFELKNFLGLLALFSIYGGKTIYLSNYTQITTNYLEVLEIY